MVLRWGEGGRGGKSKLKIFVFIQKQSYLLFLNLYAYDIHLFRDCLPDTTTNDGDSNLADQKVGHDSGAVSGSRCSKDFPLHYNNEKRKREKII